jgi:uncharacterized protein YggL (DUF469 family)
MSAPCPVFGFVVRATIDATVGRETIDALIDDLVELLEANGMTMGGGGDRLLEFVISRDGAQATDTDRQLVIEWAGSWAHVARFDVSDLVDLNEEPVQ